MAATTTNGPGTLTDVSGESAQYQHPAYVTWLPVWKQLAHVREGVGGFLDGSYLVAHPREYTDYTADVPKKPSKKLLTRRALASYENIAGAIIDTKKSALFREIPIRTVGPQDEKSLKAKGDKTSDIEEWWQNVDGCETSIDDFMARAWDTAGTFGHVYLYLDRPKGESQTAADSATPFLRLYTPLDVPDWLVDDLGELTAVKLLEAAPRIEFDEPLNAQLNYRIRTVRVDQWSLYESNGRAIDNGTINLGRLPVIPLYAKRRPMLPHLGQSVLSDPKMFIDLYNLCSEIRELLRNQTFSILNVELGTGPDAKSVDEAQAMMGTTAGTENVLFSPGKAGFITPEPSNIESYHLELERRLRTIYRLAGIHWEADIKGVEAKGSLQIKREDMNQRLAAYADELESTEYQIADLFYRMTYGADIGPKKLEADQVVIRYPDAFDTTPFTQLLQEAQAMLAMGFPPEVDKTIRKQVITKFLPDLPAEQLAELRDAVDAAPDDPTAELLAVQGVQKKLGALTITPPKGNVVAPSEAA